MPDTTFIASQTIISAAWLNAINDFVYTDFANAQQSQDAQIQILSDRLTALEGGTTTGQSTGGSTTTTTEAIKVFDFSTAAMPADAALTRLGPAYHINSAGNMTFVAGDVARFDHTIDGVYKGLLYEDAKVNLLPYALKPSAADWTEVGSVTYGETTGPDGVVNSAATLTFAGPANIGDHLIRQGITLDGTKSHQGVFWLKSMESFSILVSIRTTDGSTLETVVVPTEWTRFEVQYAAGPTYLNFDIACNDITANTTVGVWGCCLLEDETLANAMTYTTDAAAPTNQAADALTLTIANGTYDIKVCFSTGAEHTFTGVEITGGTWVVPHTLPARRITRIDVFAEGGSTVVEEPNVVEGLFTKQGAKDDMSLANDEVLPNSPTSYGFRSNSVIIQGADFRGAFYPSWWNPGNVGSNETYWPRVIVWWVLWDGATHASTNTRVKIHKADFLVLRDGELEWEKIFDTKGTNGENFRKNLQDAYYDVAFDRRAESDGTHSYRFPSNTDYIVHGWWDLGHPRVTNPQNIRGVMARIVTSLILDDPNGTDDRSSSKYLANTGADRLPEITQNVNSFPDGNKYNPGIGGNRFKRVTNQQQVHTFTNMAIGSVSVDNNGVVVSTRQTITETLFDSTTVPEV